MLGGMGLGGWFGGELNKCYNIDSLSLLFFDLVCSQSLSLSHLYRSLCPDILVIDSICSTLFLFLLLALAVDVLLILGGVAEARHDRVLLIISLNRIIQSFAVFTFFTLFLFMVDIFPLPSLFPLCCTLSHECRMK